MPSDEEWGSLIADAAAARPVYVMAETFRRAPVGSFASPPLLACDDGGEYWVKYLFAPGARPDDHRRNQVRGMVNDHVIGLLALKLQAEAVPPVRLVNLPADLIEIEPRLTGAVPGLAHGSTNAATNCTNRLDFGHGGYCQLPINRQRVAAIAVLYGLAHAADRQVIYRLGGDPLVYSVDHGHFSLAVQIGRFRDSTERAGERWILR